ncbi:hypothetical protein PspLS_01647 [Pyricularia sp. CBS 133598]|nr:hypothetical protein PspLS_01647 [Pyricularia sp. CBS 133598]
MEKLSNPSTEAKELQRHPTRASRAIQFFTFFLIQITCALAYIGTDQGSLFIPIYGSILGYNSFEEHGMWCGCSMVASFYIGLRCKPIFNTRHHFYVFPPLFAFGAMGWTWASLLAAGLGTLMLHIDYVPGILVVSFFGTGYLQGGYYEACSFAAVFLSYWFVGWELAIPMGIAIFYGILPWTYLTRADKIATLRLERKEREDQIKAKLEELDSGNHIARECEAEKERDEGRICNARKNAAEGHVLLVCWYNKRVLDYESMALKRSTNHYFDMLREVELIKNI